MRFYICMDSCGCMEPCLINTMVMSNQQDLEGEWFKGLIYIKNPLGSDFISIAQKKAWVCGGYVSGDQVKPLIVKRVL